MVYPVTYVIPDVSQAPVVTHPPVICNVLTHIWGFDGSPLNLTANAFDIESNLGSASSSGTKSCSQQQLEQVNPLSVIPWIGYIVTQLSFKVIVWLHNSIVLPVNNPHKQVSHNVRLSVTLV